MQPVCPQIMKFVEEAEKKDKSVFSTFPITLKIKNIVCNERNIRNEKIITLEYGTLIGLVRLTLNIEKDNPYHFHRCSKKKFVIGDTEFYRKRTLLDRLTRYCLDAFESK